jgi:sulfite reductase alpha subunit-like flavoprotein
VPRFEVAQLAGICFFVTSTFGNGDPPKMAQKFAAWLHEMLTHRDVIISKRVTFNPQVEEIYSGTL